jgi:hypothetical protein
MGEGASSLVDIGIHSFIPICSRFLNTGSLISYPSLVVVWGGGGGGRLLACFF